MFANKEKAERDRNTEQKGNKGRCLFEWLRSVSTAHRGKQDQCHCWDFLICPCCCWGTTGDTHSSSNYRHLFSGIVLGYVYPLMSQCFQHPRGFTPVFQHWWVPSCDIGADTEQVRLGFLTLGASRLLPQRSWYWQRHLACQIQASGRPTLTHTFIEGLEASDWYHTQGWKWWGLKCGITSISL